MAKHEGIGMHLTGLRFVREVLGRCGQDPEWEKTLAAAQVSQTFTANERAVINNLEFEVHYRTLYDAADGGIMLAFYLDGYPTDIGTHSRPSFYWLKSDCGSREVWDAVNKLGSMMGYYGYLVKEKYMKKYGGKNE